jgi:predicted RNA-binding Zn ribbon-like protein
VREALYRTVLAASTGGRPAPRDVALLEDALRRGLSDRRLVWERGDLRWGGRPVAPSADALLGEIAEDAVRLLASPERAHVRRCGACDWFYVDRTKNRSRRYCKALCADRVRSRRYYERHLRKRPARSPRP